MGRRARRRRLPRRGLLWGSEAPGGSLGAGGVTASAMPAHVTVCRAGVGRSERLRGGVSVKRKSELALGRRLRREACRARCGTGTAQTPHPAVPGRAVTTGGHGRDGESPHVRPRDDCFRLGLPLSVSPPRSGPSLWATQLPCCKDIQGADGEVHRERSRGLP